MMSSRFEIEEVSHGGHGGHGGCLTSVISGLLPGFRFSQPWPGGDERREQRQQAA
jgi:hypothetical protein